MASALEFLQPLLRPLRRKSTAGIDYPDNMNRFHTVEEPLYAYVAEIDGILARFVHCIFHRTTKSRKHRPATSRISLPKRT